LPDEFSIDDVARIFQINIYTARTRVRRLVEDAAIEKCGEYVENGTCKHRYKKKAVMVF
jgi:response regulator of citrate/malate metabolism